MRPICLFVGFRSPICAVIAMLAGCVCVVTATPAHADVVATHPTEARRALAEGRCADADTWARGLTDARPELPLGWRLVGDAARCTGEQTLEAVRAYRRYESLGGTDLQVLQALEAMSSMLGRVRVQVPPERRGDSLVAWTETDGTRTFALSEDDGSLVIRDVPPGQTIDVHVAGLGLETAVSSLPALTGGGEVSLEVAPTFVGTAQLSVADGLVSNTTLTFGCDHGERAAAPGEQVDVTAGAVVARIETERGATEVELYLEAGEVRPFDPIAHLPAELTIVGLPAGAEVRVFVQNSAGGDVIQTLEVPGGVGEIDDETGVRLAPPQRLGSLQGGAGGVFVSHPTLGGGTGTVALVGGEGNATTFDWRGMDGIPSVQARFRTWQDARASAASKNARTVIAGVATASAIASGAVLLAMAAQAEADRTQLRDQAVADSCNAACEEALRPDYDDAITRRDQLSAIGGVVLGVGGVGIALTITSDLSVRRAVRKVGDWDPEGDD